MSKLIVRLDPTSAKTLGCLHKFSLMNLQGLQPVEPKSALEFGQAFHRGVAAWLRGKSEQEALEIASTYYITSGVKLGEKDVRTPGHLINCLVAYFKQYKYDLFTTAKNRSGQPGIELPFVTPFLAFEHVDFVLCGVVDALGTQQNSKCFKDIKTTAAKNPTSYLEGYNTSLQMMFYSWALKTIGWTDHYVPYIIDGVFIGKSEPVFQRTELLEVRSDMVEELVEWLTEQCYTIATALKQGKFLRNFSFCNADFECDFKDVCHAQEAYRKHVLNKKYKQRVYDPATFGTD